MNGQWVGPYTGTPNSGKIFANIDELASAYEGMVYVVPDDVNLPTAVAHFITPDKSKTFDYHCDNILSVDRTAQLVVPWDKVSSRYPSVAFPKNASIKGFWDANSVTVSWVTDIGSTGNCKLPRSKASEPSDLQPTFASWEEFKEFVSVLPYRRYLFRGQNTVNRLRTSFHRTGRAHVGRFMNQDVPALHRHLSARTKHAFNLGDPDQNGAFYNLVQHHGYPTPLLDWTYSAYVAVFFAYRGITCRQATVAKPDDSVRVFKFDQEEWRKDWATSANLMAPPQNFSVLEFIATENERMIPQQAASTLTNIDDIESHIRGIETILKKQYLEVIDLPVLDRRRIVRELSSMGISAGSLFPGLDGACAELKERYFDI